MKISVRQIKSVINYPEIPTIEQSISYDDVFLEKEDKVEIHFGNSSELKNSMSVTMLDNDHILIRFYPSNLEMV